VLDDIVVRIEGGIITVDNNLELSNPSAGPTIRQSRGNLNVTGDLLLPNGNHDLSGGQVTAGRAVIGSLANGSSFGC